MKNSSGGAARVLYCTDTYPPQVNGVSVVTALSVAGMQERGWEAAVVAPRYPKPYGKAFATDAAGLSAVKIHERLPSLPFPPYPDNRLSAPLFHRVSRAVAEFRPHVVHCQTEFIIGRMGQIAAKRAGIPAVSSYHTDWSRYVGKYGFPRLRDSVSNYIARFHRRSERIYTPSEPARQFLRELGLPEVEVWGSGVNTDQFSPNMYSGALRQRLGVDDRFVFVHVGRLAPEKNVELVIDAFRLLNDRRPELHASLVIAGDGPSAEGLKQRAGTNVSFLGNLERHTVLPLLYASSEAFVYASETETLGLVVLEAMASGLPVIATPEGGVAENLRHEWNGLAFAKGNVEAMCAAMVRVAEDQRLRRKLQANAIKWAEAHSWKSELDRLDASYREVIKRSVTSSQSTLDRASRTGARDAGVPQDALL